MNSLAMEFLCTFLRLHFVLLSPNIYISASQSEPTVTGLWLDDRLPPVQRFSLHHRRQTYCGAPRYSSSDSEARR